MRILHLIARLNDGGPVRVLAGLAGWQGAAGCSVAVWHGACAADERDAGVLLDGRVETWLVPGLGRGLGVGDLRALTAIMAGLVRNRPDIVHTHTAKAGALGRVACRLLRIPCVHTYHGHVLDGYFGPVGNAAARAVERVLAGGDVHAHALGRAQVRDLRQRHGVGGRGRWHAWPVPVEPPSVAPVARDPDVVTVLWLGRCVPVKDPDLWVDAVIELSQVTRMRALVCGDGPLRARMLQRLHAAGIPCEAPGFMPAGWALARADALLMTSRNEGQPLAAVEAAQVGVPVVAPAVGGLVDLARLGVVRAAERNAPALAASLEAALASPCMPHPLALALTPERLGPKYLAMYRRVISARRSGSLHACKLA